MTLLIRADASAAIGTGHLMRCLALAQAWQAERGTALFLMATEAPGIEARLQQEGFLVLHQTCVLGSEADADHTIAVAQQHQADCVVVDGYHFGAEFQRRLKAAGLRVLFLDDNGHAEHYSADWVLNQNLHAHEGLYINREPYTKLLLGPRYALLRKEFWPWQGWQRQIAPVGRKVLVTLGGSDPDNVTLKVIRALQAVPIEDLTVIVVVGSSNPHYQVLQQAIQEKSVKIELLCNVTNMPNLMAWADLAIAAGGSTTWELALMGLPSLIIVLAENQKLNVEQLSSSKAAVCWGWYRDINVRELSEKIEELLLQKKLRHYLSSISQRLVDGSGSDKLTEFIKKKKFK